MTRSLPHCTKWQPSGYLSNYIEYFYSLKNNHRSYQGDEPWFPSGTMDMIFELGDPFRQGQAGGDLVTRPRAFAAGMFDQGIRIEATGQIRQIGIVFKPGKFGNFIKGNLLDYKGVITPLEEIYGQDAHRLWEKLYTCANEQDCFITVQSFLERVLREDRESNYFVDYCVERIRKSHGSISLISLAERTKTSQRHFRRIFKEYIGVSPKLYCSMVRLHSLLKMAVKQPEDLKSHSHHLGYYDLSHFSRDFKSLTGMGASDYFSTPDLISKTMLSS